MTADRIPSDPTDPRELRMTDETPKPPSALDEVLTEWGWPAHADWTRLEREARAELAALREGNKNLAEEVARNCETMRELREDRERLEWIESERAVVAPHCDAPGFNVVNEDGDGFDGLTLRAAIDAAHRRTT